MAFDTHSNFAFSTVAVAPAPPDSGLSLTVAAGDGALFGTPFNATVWPAGTRASKLNSEIVRVTDIVGDAFTIERAQEGTTALPITAGWQISDALTKKALTDIEAVAGTIDGVPVTGVPAAGQVPTATGPAAATWQTPSGGGGGWTPPGPVEEIDWFSGTGSATSELHDDTVNAGSGSLGLYGLGANDAGLTVYSQWIAPDGTTSAPAVPFGSVFTTSDGVGIYAGDWLGQGSARLNAEGEHGTANSFYGSLDLSRGTAAPAASGQYALRVFDVDVQEFAINYDGSLNWGALKLLVDTVNEGTFGLGLYPEATETQTWLSLYGGDNAPDGSGTAGAAAALAAQATAAELQLQSNWQTGDNVFRAFVQPRGTFGGSSVDLRGHTPAGVGLILDEPTTGVQAGTIQVYTEAGVDFSLPAFAVYVVDTEGTFAISYDGALSWGPNSGGGTDTVLERASIGVLQIPQSGGGIKLTSPDGTQTKQIQLSNAGTLVVI